MDGNAELLNFIYQNSQMGIETISQIITISKDAKFAKQLESQYDEYKQINQTAKEMLHRHGYDEKGISSFTKVRAYLMINMQTLLDKSTSHIAEMLIIGSNMGVIDAIKNLRAYNVEVDKEIVSLMDKLLKFEENNIKKLKEFL